MRDLSTAALDRQVDAACAALDLTLPPECRPGVLDSLRTLFVQANVLMGAPLSTSAGPAPLLRPEDSPPKHVELPEVRD
jgi:Protein of unknown function (DUF4089)